MFDCLSVHVKVISFFTLRITVSVYSFRLLCLICHIPEVRVPHLSPALDRVQQDVGGNELRGSDNLEQVRDGDELETNLAEDVSNVSRVGFAPAIDSFEDVHLSCTERVPGYY